MVAETASIVIIRGQKDTTTYYNIVNNINVARY